MRKIVLRIPTFALAGVLLVSLWLSYQFRKNELPYISDTCVLTIAAVIWFWIVSVADYMSNEAKNKTILPWIYLVSSIEALFYLLKNLSLFDETFISTLPFSLVFVFQLTNSILLSILIKKVFYARSWYFVIIETLIPAVGIITLTPDIQEWEKSDKT